MFCAYFASSGFTAGPCLVSGCRVTLESRAAHLQAALTRDSLLTICARSFAGAAWPGRAAAATSGTQPARPPANGASLKQNESHWLLLGGDATSDTLGCSG